MNRDLNQNEDGTPSTLTSSVDDQGVILMWMAITRNFELKYTIVEDKITVKIKKRERQIRPKMDGNEIFRVEILHFYKCVNFLKHPGKYSV